MRTATCFCIGQPTHLVFAFQVDVHHKTAVVQINLQSLAALTPLVIKLHHLDGVGGQVVQQERMVAPEEVLTIEQDALHLLSIQKDAAIALEFHAWQLLHERIKHRSLRQIERIGVIDEGISFVVKLYLGGRDGHAVQLPTLHRLSAHLDLAYRVGVFVFLDLYLEALRRCEVFGIGQA